MVIGCVACGIYSRRLLTLLSGLSSSNGGWQLSRKENNALARANCCALLLPLWLNVAAPPLC